jgi:hypothetical protein
MGMSPTVVGKVVSILPTELPGAAPAVDPFGAEKLKVAKTNREVHNVFFIVFKEPFVSEIPLEKYNSLVLGFNLGGQETFSVSGTWKVGQY